MMGLPADRNPFITDNVATLDYRIATDEWNALRSRLVQQRYCGAIVGAKGRGKTTLLEQLYRTALRAGQRARIVYSSKAPRPGLLRLLQNYYSSEVLFVDSFEALSLPQRSLLALLSRVRGRIVVTSHTQPRGIPLLMEIETQQQLLEALLRELVAEPSQQLIDEAVNAFDRHNGDVRLVFRTLYRKVADGEIPAPTSRRNYHHRSAPARRQHSHRDRGR